jgi:hypothetical protein
VPLARFAPSAHRWLFTSYSSAGGLAADPPAGKPARDPTATRPGVRSNGGKAGRAIQRR